MIIIFAFSLNILAFEFKLIKSTDNYNLVENSIESIKGLEKIPEKVNILYDYEIIKWFAGELTKEDAVKYCNEISIQNNLPVAYDKYYNLLDEKGNVTTDLTKVKGYRLPTYWELVKACLLSSSIDIEGDFFLTPIYGKVQWCTDNLKSKNYLDILEIVNPINHLSKNYDEKNDFMDQENGLVFIISDHEINKAYSFTGNYPKKYVWPMYFRIARTIPNEEEKYYEEYRIGKITELNKYTIELNKRYLNGSTLLIEAVKFNDIENVKYLISKNVNLDTRDYLHNNALIYATKNNNLEILKLLIEAGADYNYKLYNYFYNNLCHLPRNPERCFGNGLFETAYINKNHEIMNYLMTLNLNELYSYPEYIYTMSYVMQTETMDIFFDILKYKNDFKDLEYSFYYAFNLKHTVEQMERLYKEYPDFDINKQILKKYIQNYNIIIYDYNYICRRVEDGEIRYIINKPLPCEYDENEKIKKFNELINFLVSKGLDLSNLENKF